VISCLHVLSAWGRAAMMRASDPAAGQHFAQAPEPAHIGVEQIWDVEQIGLATRFHDLKPVQEFVMRYQPPSLLPAADFDDEELARRASERDAMAFRTIMQRYNTRLYRIARSILRSDSEAEDVVQETYVRAFTHLRTFRGESSLGTWLSRIAMNEALGRLRRERPQVEWATVESGTAESTAFDLAAVKDNPEQTMARQEIRRMVEMAIDRLPEKYRIILITRAIQGMSVEDTAELLDLRIETVRIRLHRARALLRAEMEKQIGPLVLGAFPFAGARCERLTETVLRRLGLEP
jgi:RNA polymerase sigma-70 factor, ECF subfamily